jgi:hypothetical protein
MVVKPSPSRPAPAGLKIAGKGGARVSFRLFDPRKRFEGVTGRRRKGPRIRVIGRDFDPRVPPFFRPGYVPPAPAPAAAPAPPPEGTVNAGPLCRRLAAIKLALDDLPRQARRYARWRARPFAARRPKLFSTLRPGAPPGFRKRSTHEVQAILAECQWLAHTVLEPDTS